MEAIVEFVSRTCPFGREAKPPTKLQFHKNIFTVINLHYYLPINSVLGSAFWGRNSNNLGDLAADNDVLDK